MSNEHDSQADVGGGISHFGEEFSSDQLSDHVFDGAFKRVSHDGDHDRPIAMETMLDQDHRSGDGYDTDDDLAEDDEEKPPKKASSNAVLYGAMGVFVAVAGVIIYSKMHTRQAAVIPSAISAAPVQMAPAPVTQASAATQPPQAVQSSEINSAAATTPAGAASVNGTQPMTSPQAPAQPGAAVGNLAQPQPFNNQSSQQAPATQMATSQPVAQNIAAIAVGEPCNQQGAKKQMVNGQIIECTSGSWQPFQPRASEDVPQAAPVKTVIAADKQAQQPVTQVASEPPKGEQANVTVKTVKTSARTTKPTKVIHKSIAKAAPSNEQIDAEAQAEPHRQGKKKGGIADINKPALTDYEIYAVKDDRAWIKNIHDGSIIIVGVGDVVAQYGPVKSVDPDHGIVVLKEKIIK